MRIELASEPRGHYTHDTCEETIVGSSPLGKRGLARFFREGFFVNRERKGGRSIEHP